MRVNAAVILELTIVLGALVIGVVGFLFALRVRAAALGDRLALRLALVREGALLESARRLADASRLSVYAVCSALDGAIGAIAPAVDFFLIFEEAAGELACVYASGPRAVYFSRANIALDDPRLAAVISRDHHIVVADSGAGAALHPADRSFGVFPLSVEAGRRVLVYASSATASIANSAETIAAIVDQAQPAYRLALEREDDKRRAAYDGLTGLLTPRAFRARLSDLLDRSRNDPRARIALLFVDTDHFKSWNDTFGHESGDAVLRQIAGLLKQSARFDTDLVARNGGDEFCVVLTDTDKAAAVESALALCAAIAGAERASLQPAGVDALLAITASIGVSALPTDASSASELLERADAAMYHAKKTGRNGVSYYDVVGDLRRAAQDSIVQKPVKLS